MDGTHTVRGLNRVGLRRAGFDRSAHPRAAGRLPHPLPQPARTCARRSPGSRRRYRSPTRSPSCSRSSAARRAAWRGPAPRGVLEPTMRQTTEQEHGSPRHPQSVLTRGTLQAVAAPTRVIRGSMLHQRRFIVGAAVIAAAVAYLVYAGIRTTSMYYFEMDEFLASKRGARGRGPARRRAGCGAGSMHWDPRTNELAFELARKDGTDAGAGRVPRHPARHVLRGARGRRRGPLRRGRAAREADHDQLSRPSTSRKRAARRGGAAAGLREPMPELGRLAICLALLCRAVLDRARRSSARSAPRRPRRARRARRLRGVRAGRARRRRSCCTRC